MSFYVDDMVYAEKLVLNEFKSFIIKDYGKEYISIERDLLVTRLQIILHDFIFGKREETVLKENKNDYMKRHFETHHKDLITKGGIVDGNTLYEEFSDDMSITLPPMNNVTEK
jgi:hypothetical protein